MMRIITGVARGAKLKTLEGDNTRPTTERVKEAIFSYIQFDIDSRTVLDLFAGSGQMGLEAVSRGASHATLVDKSRAAAAVITENAQRTRLAPAVTVVCSDATEFLRVTPKRPAFDLVFLDPPYAMAQKLLPEAIEKMTSFRQLRDGALLVCETGEPFDLFETKPELRDVFTLRKAVRYGVTHVTFYEKTIPGVDER